MNSTTELFARTPSRGWTYLASWVGIGLILLAAGLNLGAAVLAEYAPRAVPAKVLLTYEQRKPTLTLALVAGGLILVLRDVVVSLTPARPRKDPAPVKAGTFTLARTCGGVPLVSSQYLTTSQAAGPAGSHGRLAV
jgi:hypothetical protein